MLSAVALLPLADVLVASFTEGIQRTPVALLRAGGLASGALAEGLIVVVIVLGLRSTTVERVLGSLDRVTRVHHRAGAVAYAAVLAHPLALAGAEALTSWRGSSRLLFDVQRPSIALGWASLVLLVVVVVAPFAERLRHETRRRLHALGWLAAAAGIAHAVASRGLRLPDVVLLALLVAAALEAVLVVTVRTTRCRVTAAARLGDALLEVELEPLGRSVRFRPGQFLFLRFYDPRTGFRCREFHPFTIVSSPRDERLRIIIKGRGDCTRALLEVTAGAMAEARGPFGRLFCDEAPRRQIWLAGGIGVAPFLSAARSLSDDAPEIDLFYSTAQKGDAVHLDELQEIARRRPSFHLHFIADLADGLPNAERVLSEAQGGARDAEFFIAGPAAFASALRAGLVASRVRPKTIHHERFDWL